MRRDAQDYLVKGQVLGRSPSGVLASQAIGADGTLLVRCIRYTIERKRIEEALRKSNRCLEGTLAELRQTQQQLIQQERLRALGQMASGIAHDFNNALTPILGFSEVLLSSPDTLDDRARAGNYLQIIHTAAKDAASVVSRLCNFYRYREEREILYPVNLNQLVKVVVLLTQPRWKDQAQAKGITIGIETDLAPELPSIPGVEAELREALTNLIFNAVDAMADDSPSGRRRTITLRTRLGGNHLVLEISDTGVGMTETVRRRCFEPFFSTKGTDGTGLGLSMVFGTIQRHKGRIEVESQVGKGTTFRLHLPTPTQEIPPKSDAGIDLKPALLMHVLVVDDEPLVQQTITEYLAADGHTLEVASDGREGLEMFQAGRFDLVVTDRAMPKMSGNQLAAAIKQIAPHTPVILLTGFGDIMQATGEQPADVDVTLSKPITLTVFRDALAKARRPSSTPPS